MESSSIPSRYVQTTRDVSIAVHPQFIPEQSNPQRNIYAFAYTIVMQNLGRDTVQLINRHWVIISDGKQFDDVKGEGVVGLQPLLRPGEEFRYTSGAIINHPVGGMYGTYTFRTPEREFFDVVIPNFDLIYFDASLVH